MKAKEQFNTDGPTSVKQIPLRSRLVFRFEKIIAGAVVLACAFTISCGGTGANKDNEDVARVGSRDITMKQVDAVIKQQLDQSGGASLSASELVAARLSVLDT